MTWHDKKMLWWHWEILYQNEIKCSYCGDAISNLGKLPDTRAGTIDHVHPKALGGTDDLSNLVPSCFTCNTRKGMMKIDEFISILGVPNDKINHRRITEFGNSDITD